MAPGRDIVRTLALAALVATGCRDPGPIERGRALVREAQEEMDLRDELRARAREHNRRAAALVEEAERLLLEADMRDAARDLGEGET